MQINRTGNQFNNLLYVQPTDTILILFRLLIPFYPALLQSPLYNKSCIKYLVSSGSVKALQLEIAYAHAMLLIFNFFLFKLCKLESICTHVR